MKPHVTVTKTKDRSALLKRAMAGLVRARLLVGVPEGTAHRAGDDGTPVNNATLAYIHEKGAPARNIPARPFLEPGIRAALPQITGSLEVAAACALRGNRQGVEDAYTRAGLVCVNHVKAAFVDNGWPALTPGAVRSRQYRRDQASRTEADKGKRRPRQPVRGEETSPADANPLMDTLGLRKAQTSVIRGLEGVR